VFVRFLGFTVSAGPDIQYQDLFDRLGERSSTSRNIEKKSGRMLFVDSNSNDLFYIGLIVTIKNQRKFCELMESGNSFKVKVSKVGDSSHLMEFNFFVLNKENGVGLYQHYHQSCSIGQAMNMIRSEYFSMLDDHICARKQELVKDGIDELKAAKIAKKEVRRRFKWEQLVRKENLPELLAELDRIKAFETVFSYLEPEQTEFEHLSGLVKKQRRKFIFVRPDNPFKLIQAISGVVSDMDLKSGRVFGVDCDGYDRILKLQNNPDNFGEYNYDSVAEKINDLDVKKFNTSWVVRKLLEVCDEKSHIFKAKIK